MNISPRVISTLKDLIKKNNLMLNSESQIIFLFGADSKKINSGRNQLIEYTKKKHPKLKEYLFINAEDFINNYKESIKDLLSLETELSYYTDCIIIILESEGSFAELGAFSMRSDLREKILIINDKRFLGVESFINDGPVKLVVNSSKFGEVIYYKNNFLKTVGEIENRLTETLRKNRKTITVLNNREIFNKRKNNEYVKYKLMLISDLIHLFAPIKKLELIEVLKKIYESEKYFNIDIDLSLLCSLHILELKSEFYISKQIPRRQFYFYKTANFSLLRSDVINFYSKYSSERLKQLV